MRLFWFPFSELIQWNTSFLIKLEEFLPNNSVWEGFPYHWSFWVRFKKLYLWTQWKEHLIRRRQRGRVLWVWKEPIRQEFYWQEWGLQYPCKRSFSIQFCCYESWFPSHGNSIWHQGWECWSDTKKAFLRGRKLCFLDCLRKQTFPMLQTDNWDWCFPKAC